MSFHQSFMGMPSYMSYQNARPPVAERPSVAFAQWWPTYSRALFILARSHVPTDPNSEQAMKVFMVNLAKLLPSPVYSKHMIDFLEMKPQVVDVLTRSIPNVFAAYPRLESTLRTDPKSFMDKAFKNQDSQLLFLYVYLLNAYMIEVYNQANIRYPLRIPTLNEQRSLYQLDRIGKADWGNAIWFILHTTSLYAPEPMADSFVRYRNMLSSLRYLLPCPKCRQHLTQNLTKIDFVNCSKTREDLFQCSWLLHNIVNVSESKPTVGLQEAFAMYTF